MILELFKKKKINNEISILQTNKESLKNEVRNLNETKLTLTKEITNMLNEKNKIDKQIKNRESFFIEHELMAIDTLTGLEFEEYFANVLVKLGYNAQVTKATGDDGGDIIATKDNIKYVFQCKNYSDVVGNKAVQEVYTAKDIYKCNKAIVITNNYFSKQAKKEAEILNVTLWDRDILLKLLCETFKFDINNIDKKIYFKNSKKINEDYLTDESEDEMLDEVIEMCIETGQASTSYIQRAFKIGYARAGKIIDQMEEKGIISSYQGSKPREILITKEQWNKLKNN